MKLIDVVKMNKKPKNKVLGYVLFEGKSQIDNNNIVAVITLNSNNTKTGNMAQLWILNADITPIEANKIGKDISICGMCKHRKFLGGSCYVNVGQAPQGIYKAYKKNKYEFLNINEYSILNGLSIRFGAYGDPAALPMAILANLKAVALNNTSYTHQWKNPKNDALKSLSMASVDSIKEAKEATKLGWRYFRVASLNSTIQKNEIVCPNVTNGINCKECNLCCGNKINAKNIVIPIHGTWAKRFKEI